MGVAEIKSRLCTKNIPTTTGVTYPFQEIFRDLHSYTLMFKNQSLLPVTFYPTLNLTLSVYKSVSAKKTMSNNHVLLTLDNRTGNPDSGC